MDLPPVSYAPRTRQRPLPIVLPVMAGLGIAISSLFALAFGLLAMSVLPVGFGDLVTILAFAFLLLVTACHVLVGFTALWLLKYRIATARAVSIRIWIAVAGLTVAFSLAAVTLASSEHGSRSTIVLGIAGLYVVQTLVPAFLITVLRQPLIIQAYEREARRRVALGELESQP